MLTLLLLLFLNEYDCFVVIPEEHVIGDFNLSNIKPVNDGPPPPSLDWRTIGMVSPVKNQLHCEACWAFSAVANIESHLKIHRGEEVLLSEQFLIDCDRSNEGCASGSILRTFANIVTNFGGVLRYEDYYPYAERRLDCRWNPSQLAPTPVAVIGLKRVKPNEQYMIEALFHYGPLSSAINAASMGKWGTGKMTNVDEPTDEDCNPKAVNHAVLIVGYGTHVSNTGKETPYWIIKNSWGPVWGLSGYYFLVRGRNACGIESDVSFALVK